MISTRKLTISAMVVALYIVVLYVTQSVSFGAYQIRIATSLYALAYAFPFLVIPMGIGNLISNFLFGGLGIFDMVGGLWCRCSNDRHYRRNAQAWPQRLVGHASNRICASTMCTNVAQSITWNSVLAISIEPHRRSNYSSSSWFCIGESFDEPS